MADGDFVSRWEERLLEVGLPFLDPKPKLIEGSAEVEFSDESGLVVVVNVGPESPLRSGFWLCEVIVQYDYGAITPGDEVSERWGQILTAYGNGTDNTEPLRDRLSEGDLHVIGGVNGVQYNRSEIHDKQNHIKQFSFEARLGIAPPT